MILQVSPTRWVPSPVINGVVYNPYKYGLIIHGFAWGHKSSYNYSRGPTFQDPCMDYLPHEEWVNIPYLEQSRYSLFMRYFTLLNPTKASPFSLYFSGISRVAEFSHQNVVSFGDSNCRISSFWLFSKTMFCQKTPWGHHAAGGRNPAITSWYGKNLIIFRVSHIPDGAGCLPSTVELFFARTHYGSMGRTVFLPTGCFLW